MPLAYEKNNRYEREVYCPKCHIYSFRSDNHPKCDNCQSELIRVTYSVLTGERLTGSIQKETDFGTACRIKANSASTGNSGKT
jgi:hypothetical protein